MPVRQPISVKVGYLSVRMGISPSFDHILMHTMPTSTQQSVHARMPCAARPAGVGDDPSAVRKGHQRVSDWPGPQAGSTAVVAVCDGSSIALANVGDARAVRLLLWPCSGSCTPQLGVKPSLRVMYSCPAVTDCL